MPVLLIRY